jgi:hypothetical protein
MISDIHAPQDLPNIRAFLRIFNPKLGGSGRRSISSQIPLNSNEIVRSNGELQERTIKNLEFSFFRGTSLTICAFPRI